MFSRIVNAIAALSLLTAITAWADEPCPEPIKPTSPAGEGGCAPDWNAEPQHFDFGALQKQMAEAKAKEEKAKQLPKAETEQLSQPTESSSPEQAKQRVLPKTCTYKAYAWDTKHKRSTDHYSVEKAYDEVTDDERDPNDPRCTVCSEDQVSIDTSKLGLKTGTIKVCWAYADQVENALKTIAQSGSFDIEKLEGYRPGKTRGKIDSKGLRTEWSNHSFGAAIDINAHKNAIYSNCTTKIVGSKEDVAGCKRGIGGDYDPKKNPRTSITRAGIVYAAFTPFWKWGGEIDGTTKDIMHFSITGY